MELKEMKGDDVLLVDVRNAPKHNKKKKIKGSIELQQVDLVNNLDQLPKEKMIVVYCLETWCNLDAKSCITLIEKVYEYMELRVELLHRKQCKCSRRIIKCLLSKLSNLKRKTPFTVESISVDEINEPSKN